MDFMERYYPESQFGGFTNIDGTVHFYTRVNALLEERDTLLDVGCGRGRYLDDPVRFRRELRIFRNRVKKVIGIDVDPTAAENPFLDEFHLMEGEQWPVGNEEADLCLCDWVMEHIKHPDQFFLEAGRVLKPGGYLCIRTSNMWGYAGIVTRLIPNRYHAAVLRWVQTGRKEEDVFPTYNRCNTPGKMRARLAEHGFQYTVYTHEPEPAYLDFSRLFYALGVLCQRVMPPFMRRTILVYARKVHPSDE